MKKKILEIWFLLILITVFTACSANNTYPDTDSTSDDSKEGTTVTNDEVSEETTSDGLQHIMGPTGEKLNFDVQQWLSNEIIFESHIEYDDPVYNVDMDVTFTNNDTGTVIKMPAFWNGGKEWRVRYALTETGSWSYVTSCTDDTNAGLHYHVGNINCTPYTGELDIYKHGFVKTEKDKRYFVYADGTPFFYLGDTHWTLPMEEIDGIGKISQETADEYGITSQFRYIMDYRAEQGYTVIQSQQLAVYIGKTGNSWMGDENGTIFNYGVNGDMLAKFNELDRYFAYIAEKGFVHSHTQFSYPSELIDAYLNNDINKYRIDKLCRYWVARYSAYPVMWATAQEGDSSYYEYNGCNSTNNPWLLVIDSVSEYDPYDHPSTCHQENAGARSNTRVKNSSFAGKESHDWFAAQFSLDVNDGSKMSWGVVRDYWKDSGMKPVVNYEGRYDHFWTGTFGSRVQGWTSFLNGCVGYGYGVQPIWSIFWAELDGTSQTSDEVEEFVLDQNWLEGLYQDTGRQLIYMKDFLQKYEWWNLIPCFDDSVYYRPSGTRNYSVATIGNSFYIAYFYGTSENDTTLGSFTEMENGEYEICHINCRTGEMSTETVTVENGEYLIPGKSDSGDWAFSMKLIEN